ncbi:MAG: Uma2 family endonuclease [Bacteroidota bacterium]
MGIDLKHLLEAPNLPQLVKEAQAVLVEEARLREQFYNDIDETVKAEFINGQVVMHSPVKRMHNNARKWLLKLMDTYVEIHQLGEVQDEKIMIHLSRNSFEPDIAFWNNEKAKDFQDDQMLFPAPDFIVEVLSPSTTKNDRGVKMIDYALHQVQEYWIIDPAEQIVEQYLLQKEQAVYDLHSRKEVGDEISSHAIAGFRIPVNAIFFAASNLEALKQLGKV